MYIFFQNAGCFIILTCLVPVLFTFYIHDVLKLKKYNSDTKRLRLITMTTNLFVIANVKQLRTGGSFRILLPFFPKILGGCWRPQFRNFLTVFTTGLSLVRFWRALEFRRVFETPKPPPLSTPMVTRTGNLCPSVVYIPCPRRSSDSYYILTDWLNTGCTGSRDEITVVQVAIPRFMRNLTIHYRIHKSMQRILIPSQFYSFYNLAPDI